MWAGLRKSFKALKDKTEVPREEDLPPEGLGTQAAASPFLWVSACCLSTDFRLATSVITQDIYLNVSVCIPPIDSVSREKVLRHSFQALYHPCYLLSTSMELHPPWEEPSIGGGVPKTQPRATQHETTLSWDLSCQMRWSNSTLETKSLVGQPSFPFNMSSREAASLPD